MHNDDAPVGRLLTRREMVSLLGASGIVLATGGALTGRRTPRGTPFPACVVRPEQTEGPYFVDEELKRSDIRTDPSNGKVSAGVPLALTLALSHVSEKGCEPLAGAQVDVWHCDGLGLYSDVHDRSFDTKGQKFLRGYQVSDSSGNATFQTIYPGWYPGRAVHIHFKIRTPAGDGRKAAEFTSQLYFDDAFSDKVHASAPYASKGPGRTKNAADRIYQDGGDQLILAPTSVANGLAGTFAIGLQLG